MQTNNTRHDNTVKRNNIRDRPEDLFTRIKHNIFMRPKNDDK